MAQADKTLTVRDLTNEIKAAVEGRLGSVAVCGEIADFRGIHGSGHTYCALKDEAARIRLVIWRSTKLAFKLSEGMKVTVRGAVEVYGPHGSYQLIARSIEPEGLGALQLAFRQLCERLKAEGLFDQEHKKPLPKHPRRIGIVTAPTSAAIRDMLRILKRRDPRLDVVIYPARMQGDSAAGEIAAGIRFFNRQRARLGIDALIVGRGGGSFEDLWAFNEEVVARAIFNSQLPIVSAVGHEIDTTVADFVADVRAATPSEAAELIVPEQEALFDQVSDSERRLAQAWRFGHERRVQRLELAQMRAEAQSPQRRVREDAQRLDGLADRLGFVLERRLDTWRRGLEHADGRLRSLSPLAVLKRGYGLVRDAKGHVIESIAQVADGEELRVAVADGVLRTRILGREARVLE